jgi:hypothetical protein
MVLPLKFLGWQYYNQDGIVRELADVRYVVEIKSNLISLGVLDSCGYKYTCQGGALTLWKGSLVLMKATKVDNL